MCLGSWTRTSAAYILGIESVKNSYSDMRIRTLILTTKIMLLSLSESYTFQTDEVLLGEKSRWAPFTAGSAAGERERWYK